jgi:hypothetical protein
MNMRGEAGVADQASGPWVFRESSPTWLEALDIQGALQPIAFAAGGNPHGFVDLAPFEPRMTFREEEPPREWSVYAWDGHGRPHTSALYSPWQLLYVENVVDAPQARLGPEMLALLPSSGRLC